MDDLCEYDWWDFINIHFVYFRFLFLFSLVYTIYSGPEDWREGKEELDCHYMWYDGDSITLKNESDRFSINIALYRRISSP